MPRKRTGLTRDAAGKRTPLFIIWKSMRQRCGKPRSPHYRNYGARGIKVCDRWTVFANFAADMGPRPDGLVLDRIDNDGNYEPGNCRWTTRKANQRNRRDNRLLTCGGVTKTLAEWAEITGLGEALKARIKRGWNPERAINTPRRWVRRPASIRINEGHA